MGGFKKGVWIARDQNGKLYAYLAKPKKSIDMFVRNGTNTYNHSLMQLPKSWYKNIKFENSPIFVPITEDFVEQFIKK